jgi:magnesium-transporting ATPase (P-type)
VSAPHAETADRVVFGLNSDPIRGLDEAGARARLLSHGPNELRAAPQVPRWRKLLGQFVDPLVLLLLGAVVVSLAVWLIEGSHGVPFETLAIVSIVLLNAVLLHPGGKGGAGCGGAPTHDDHHRRSDAGRASAARPVQRARKG